GCGSAPSTPASAAAAAAAAALSAPRARTASSASPCADLGGNQAARRPRSRRRSLVLEPAVPQREHRALRILRDSDPAHADVDRPGQLAAAQLVDLRQ